MTDHISTDEPETNITFPALPVSVAQVAPVFLSFRKFYRHGSKTGKVIVLATRCTESTLIPRIEWHRRSYRLWRRSRCTNRRKKGGCTKCRCRAARTLCRIELFLLAFRAHQIPNGKSDPACCGPGL